MEKDKLDNPGWYSLSEMHSSFAIDYEDIKFYQPQYCSFGGWVNLKGTEAAIDLYASLTDIFFVVGNKPNFSDKVRLVNELVCNQMVIDKRINIEPNQPITELRTEKHEADLFNLVSLVQPGYFRTRTPDMGKYYGIYKDNMLVAVTGERMKMYGYTELSAIVTHPAHTGNGYAKQLITHASHIISDEGKIAYLHVAYNNVAAIQLYEKLGFKTRRKISFWQFTPHKN